MTIKVYHSDQVGAPILNGTVGTLINVLDAVLVNGYQQVEVASLTRAGTVVTVTCSSAHGYANPVLQYWNVNGVGNICTIAGAAESEYNGEWAVTYIDPLTFSYDIGSASPESPATGEIFTKRAPAGFSKPFSDTNRGVYRSNDITSRRHFLQVNDVADCPNGQGARFAGWRGYEKMTGMDAGEFPFPTIVAAGIFGQYICKSSALDGNSRAWTIISDGKFFFLWLSPNTAGANFAVDYYSRLFGFGDFKTTVPDAYGTLISASSSGETAMGASIHAGLMRPSNSYFGQAVAGSGWTCIARRYNGQATPVFAAGLSSDVVSYNQECFGNLGILQFPNPYDNRYYLGQIKVFDGSIIRGTLPYYQGYCGVVHSPREIISNVVGREGRHFIYLRATPVHTSYIGGVYIDITGDANGKWS